MNSMEISDNYSNNTKIALDSVDNFSDQCSQAWQESRFVSFPDNYSEIENLVICGMGGSALPGYIIKSVFPSKVPLLVRESYDLPNWAGRKTLVLLSSYSGNTEEILSCAKQAKDRGCLITGMTSGGELEKFLNNDRYPFYSFEPRYNPSNLPRFGIGYKLFGQLGILNKLKIIDQVIENDFDNLKAYQNEIKDSAMKLAKEVKEKVLIVFTADHLVGNGRALANQINETAKTMAFQAILPSADHSLIEGFKKSEGSVAFIFIKSNNYSLRMQERFSLTRQVIEKEKFATYVYEVKECPLMQEIMETLLFSGFFSVGLAMERGNDPLAIPAVDFIKGNLSSL